ncbi:hypothetical protein Tco_0762020 [Tanacetum coccineum]
MLAQNMAAIMNIMVSIPATKTSSSSYMVTSNRTSTRNKHIDKFALRSAPTDNNDVILSTLSKDEAILEFFEKFIYTISQDLQFVIDDISGEDTSAIGVTWHLVVKLISRFCGEKFSRLYYLLDDNFTHGEDFLVEIALSNINVCYGRDIVEPAVKPWRLCFGSPFSFLIVIDYYRSA